MPTTPIVIALPIADRPAACRFYEAALDLPAVGEPADDGVPEPLQFDLREGLRLMLVPRGGFGWAVGGREVAEPGRHECLLSLPADDPASVDAVVARAERAGATVVTAPGPQPWGYCGLFADPDGHLWQVIAP